MQSLNKTKTLFKSPLFLLSLIIIFGIITRAWFFWKDGFHVDEKYTFDLVQHDIWYVIQFSLTNDCNPPLFYIIDWFSIRIAGMSTFGERLPSVIFGILLIPATYAFGKELRSTTTGLFAAACIATLGNIWYYSQFGRAYMLECLLFTLLCIYFIRLVRNDNRTYHWIGMVVFSVLLAFTHLFATIPLAIMWVYLVWHYKLRSIKWVAITGLLSSPLLLLFNAILGWRTSGRGEFATVKGWYGAPFNQLIVFAPLEFFGFVFVIMMPLIAYATWMYKDMKEVLILMGTFVLSYAALLAVCDTTPVFLRYLLLFIPVAVAIGFLPVANFADSAEYNAKQKWFVIGSFAVFYIAITIYAFATGVYHPKG